MTTRTTSPTSGDHPHDRTYGGAADTWNTGLSAANLLAMVNDVDFGVFFQAQANIANADIEVDYTVTINYTAPPVTVYGPRGARYGW